LKTRPVVAVDFDGTVCNTDFSRPYIPKEEIKDKPNKHVVEYLRKLSKSGWIIIIFSSRWWGDYNVVRDWLKRHNVPYNDIILGRFKADLYIDDKTIRPGEIKCE